MTTTTRPPSAPHALQPAHHEEQEPTPALMTKQAAARYLMVSVSQLEKWRRSNELHPRRAASRLVRYTRADLDAFAQQLAEVGGEGGPA